MTNIHLKINHEYWMGRALVEAQKAYRQDEVPVGAIIVTNDKITGKGYNQKELLKDPTAHAEVIAITAAASTVNDWRLSDSILYVTKEPCPMCAGAIVNARLKMVVFGCYDKDSGCCGSVYQFCGDSKFKNKTAVKGGVLEKESLHLLQDFFRSHRK